MRTIYIFFFTIPLACIAAELPHLELISREGLTTHLRITNASNQTAFFSPYIIIEEYYDKPACDDCAQGWIARRPRSLGNDVSVESGSSYKFATPTSFQPTRITIFYAPTPSSKKDGYTPLKIELPASERPAVVHSADKASPELSNDEKRKKILRNLQTISGAGDQCLLIYGIESVDITIISKEFPDEMEKALAPVDGEDYSEIVYTNGKTLQVETNTLGVIRYPKK